MQLKITEKLKIAINIYAIIYNRKILKIAMNIYSIINKKNKK